MKNHYQYKWNSDFLFQVVYSIILFDIFTRFRVEIPYEFTCSLFDIEIQKHHSGFPELKIKIIPVGQTAYKYAQ